MSDRLRGTDLTQRDRIKYQDAVKLELPQHLLTPNLYHWNGKPKSYMLRRDVHDWCKETLTPDGWKFSTYRNRIHIIDKRDAVLFKFRWWGAE